MASAATAPRVFDPHDVTEDRVMSAFKSAYQGRIAEDSKGEISFYDNLMARCRLNCAGRDAYLIPLHLTCIELKEQGKLKLELADDGVTIVAATLPNPEPSGSARSAAPSSRRSFTGRIDPRGGAYCGKS